MWVWVVICAALAVALAAFGLGQQNNDVVNDQTVQLFIGLTLLAVIGIGTLSQYGGRMGQALRDLLVWLGLGLALVVGYSFRDEVRIVGHRVLGELVPPGEAISVYDRSSTATGDQSVRLRRRPDGHFIARMEVNGVTMTMLVDTGASTVVLKPADARLAGVDVDRLTYTVPVNTANGTAFAAAVRLKRLAVGNIVMEGVEALVAKPGALNESLLGMTFLTRLRSYEFSGEFLTLRG
jgi:aspartyl protease family protein